MSKKTFTINRDIEGFSQESLDELASSLKKIGFEPEQDDSWPDDWEKPGDVDN